MIFIGKDRKPFGYKLWKRRSQNLEPYNQTTVTVGVPEDSISSQPPLKPLKSSLKKSTYKVTIEDESLELHPKPLKHPPPTEETSKEKENSLKQETHTRLTLLESKNVIDDLQGKMDAEVTENNGADSLANEDYKEKNIGNFPSDQPAMHRPVIVKDISEDIQRSHEVKGFQSDHEEERLLPEMDEDDFNDDVDIDDDEEDPVSFL